MGETKIEESERARVVSRMTSSESAIESVSRPFNLRRPRPSCLSLPPSSRASFRCMRRRRRRRPRFGPPTHARSPPKQTAGGQADRRAGRPLSDMERAAGMFGPSERANERSIHRHRGHCTVTSLSHLRPSAPFLLLRWCGALSLGSPTTDTSSKKMRQGVKGGSQRRNE